MFFCPLTQRYIHKGNNLKLCGAKTANETPCSKRKLWLSKYCWLHQDPSAWIYGVILGGTMSFLATYWGVHYSFSKQQLAIAFDKTNKKPEVEFQVLELKENELRLVIQSTQNDSSPIDNLFFKFDIPGVFLSHKERHKEKTEYCSLGSSVLAGNGGITIAETIYGQCRKILPGGNYSTTISFTPTKPLPIPGRELLDNPSYPTHFNPLMDLRDYSQIKFTWFHNGEEQVETMYLDLTGLKYIQKDNQQMVNQLKWHNSIESVKKMEQERKDW